jgi:methionyl-tRNA synthetase
MPETGDTDFSWHEFVRRNNDELVATYGNLVHRVLTFVHRHIDGCVPTPGELDSLSQTLLNRAKDTLDTMDGLLYRCHFREAMRVAMFLAQEANRYLEEKSPWKMTKQDGQASATALYVAISVLSCLRTVLYPFLPFSSQKLHEFLGFRGNVKDDGWQLNLPAPGQKLLPPKPLFSKFDANLVDEETNRLGHTQC